jgi:hypothetical protein
LNNQLYKLPVQCPGPVAVKKVVRSALPIQSDVALALPSKNLSAKMEVEGQKLPVLN